MPNQSGTPMNSSPECQKVDILQKKKKKKIYQSDTGK